MNAPLLKWTAIERIGNSKIARQSYLWFFIIPILAELFQNVPPQINIDFISDKLIPISLSFPFKWYLFFAVGLLFMLANLIYQIACPHIVREFRNFSLFIESGYPNAYLIEQGEINGINAEETKDLKEVYFDGLDKPKHHDYYNEKLREKQREYFDKVFNLANSSNILFRILGTIVVILALILIGYIFYENIESVYEIALKKV